MRAYHLSFVDALRRLQILSVAADFFHNYLFKDNSDRAIEAKRYLQERGFSNELLLSFNWVFAPSGSCELLFIGQGIFTDVIIEAGLGVPSKYGSGLFDLFRDRIILLPLVVESFPIQGMTQGSHSTFGPKYLNSPETRVFKKSEVLYGADKLAFMEDKPDQVVIVEGYFDVLTMHQAGIHFATASLGTSLSLRQIEIAAKLSNQKRVILNFDNDMAGYTAAIRAADQLLEPASRRGIDLNIAILPDGTKDADEFIRLYSATDYYQRVLKHAIPLVNWRAQIAIEEFDGNIPSRARCIESLGKIFSKIGNSSHRSHLAHIFAEKLTKDDDEPAIVVSVEDQILRLVRKLRTRQTSKSLSKPYDSKVSISNFPLYTETTTSNIVSDDEQGKGTIMSDNVAPCLEFVEEFFIRMMIHYDGVREHCVEMVWKDRFRFSNASLWSLWKWLARNGLKGNAEQLSIALEAEETELYQRHAHLFQVDDRLVLEMMDPNEAVEAAVAYMERIEREQQCSRLLTRWKQVGDELNKLSTRNKSRIELCREEQKSLIEAVKVERILLREMKQKKKHLMEKLLGNCIAGEERKRLVV
eukprot:jgi/Galph1/1907/GphlegSOOS_G25.1